MARYSERDTSKTYSAAERFKDECLKKDGSLLFDGASVWTPDNLATLHRVFVASPDEGDRSFVDKFRDQVKPAGQTITRLAAEMLCVYFLFPSNVGGYRKRELVSEVLGWGGDALSPDHVVSAAFERGIGSGGQGYNTRRPFEIGFLIEFAIAWKKASDPERAEALADPWKFQARVDGVEGAETRQLRHMLLHLVFPDHFERIASGNHKWRVLSAFDGLVQSPPEDSDEHLLAVRRELEKLLPGKQLDFYWPPLEAAWYDTSEAGTEFAPLDVIRHKRQVVLYGPPGTGKTYRAKRLAERIIRGAALKRMGPARYFREQSTVDAAVKHNVHRLQLHPAYSYEDFIRGLHITESGATEYRAGYLPQLVKEIEDAETEVRLPHILILDEINRTDLSRMLGECFSLLEDRNQVIDLPARDKDGKAMTLSLPEDLFVIGTMNLIDQSIEQVDFALRRRFLWILCPFDADALLSASEALWRQRDVGLEWERVEPDFRRLAGAAKVLNHEIRTSALLGAQYEVGHTYLLDVVAFLRDDLGSKPRARKSFLWRKGEALRPVEKVWRLSLQPLLEQYLSGLETAARDAELGRLRQAFMVAPESE